MVHGPRYFWALDSCDICELISVEMPISRRPKRSGRKTLKFETATPTLLPQPFSSVLLQTGERWRDYPMNSPPTSFVYPKSLMKFRFTISKTMKKKVLKPPINHSNRTILCSWLKSSVCTQIPGYRVLAMDLFV